MSRDRQRRLGTVEGLLAMQDFEGAVAESGRMLRADPEDMDALVLRAEALVGLGALEEALTDLERAHALEPAWEDGPILRSELLCELGRLDEAQTLLDTALETDPDDPDALWWTAVVRELNGDAEGADACYARAATLDPELARPTRMSDDAFLSAAREALERIPSEIREAFSNIEVGVRDTPDLARVRSGDGAPTALILGWFEGPTAFRMGGESAGGEIPSLVLLFKKNLERACRTEDELREQIAITVLHELGHYLGLEEDDMRRLGLE